MNNNQSDDILVTIITPVRNGEATVARTIESVLHQTYRNIEYIVMDGASDDGTLDVIKKYEHRFIDGKSLEVVSEPDKGMYEALNKGIKRAKGFLIGNINSNDWYEPDAVEEMVKLYQKEKYDIAWADLRIHRKNGSFIKKAKISKIWTTAHFCHPTMFARREVLTEYSYLEKNIDDDFDMILRANKFGVKFSTANKTLANYTFGGISTKKSFSNMLKRISMKYKTYQRNGYSRFYGLYCVAIEGAKFLFGE